MSYDTVNERFIADVSIFSGIKVATLKFFNPYPFDKVTNDLPCLTLAAAVRVALLTRNTGYFFSAS